MLRYKTPNSKLALQNRISLQYGLILIKTLNYLLLNCVRPKIIFGRQNYWLLVQINLDVFTEIPGYMCSKTFISKYLLNKTASFLLCSAAYACCQNTLIGDCSLYLFSKLMKHLKEIATC